MKKLLFYFLALIIFNTFISAFANEANYAENLRPGDVILISLNCYECIVIESETSSKFSHSAVVLKNEGEKILVAQSLGKLETIYLENFLSLRRKGTSAYVFRPKELKKLSLNDSKELGVKMFKLFENSFRGLPFDSQYLWNNKDLEGREKLYCSEFIAKFLDAFLTAKTPVEHLSFKKNWDYWEQHFNGDVPEGLRGNSPSSFSRDQRFEFIYNI